MGDGFYVRAIWAYEAPSPEELSFFDDEFIYVTSWDDEAWYYGQVDERAGWFPSSYVEVVDENGAVTGDSVVLDPTAPQAAVAAAAPPVAPKPTPPAAPVLPTDAEKRLEIERRERAALSTLLDTYTRQPKFGNDKALKKLKANIEDADRKIAQLSTEIDRERALKGAALMTSQPQTPRGSSGDASAPKVSYARVLWEYKAAKSDELSMKEDDVVTITSSDADGQWYFGSIGPASGWFPSSWVAAVDAADVTCVSDSQVDADSDAQWDNEWDDEGDGMELVGDTEGDDIYEALKTEWTAKRGSLGSDHYAEAALAVAAVAGRASAKLQAQEAQEAHAPVTQQTAPQGEEKHASGAMVVQMMPSAQAPSRKWRDLVDADVREAIGKEEVHRQESIYETLKTEEDYVRDLKTIISVFIEPMRKQKIVSQKHLAVLFSNLEQLVPVNEELCGRLQLKTAENVIVEAVGDVFLTLAEFFKVYTLYCGNYDSALILYDKESKRNKSFKQFIDAATLREECRGLNLLSYLIKPVQRICKYPLLIREILRHTTPDKPDHQALTKALTKIETVVAIVNEAGRAAEGTKKMLDIQARLKTYDGEPVRLMTPSRRLLRDDLFVEQMQSKRDDRRLLLFNDLLLITRPGKNKLHLISAIEMHACMVFDLDDERDSLDAFEIVHVGRAKYTFMAANPTAKKIWLDDLVELTKEFLERQQEEWQSMDVPEGDVAPLEGHLLQRVGSFRPAGDDEQVSPGEVRRSKVDDGEDTSPPRRRHSFGDASVRSRKTIFAMSVRKPARKDNSAPELAEIEEPIDDASVRKKQKDKDEKEKREREERERKDKEKEERRERERKEKEEKEKEREEREERERKEREIARRGKEESRREREEREKREKEDKEREKELRRLEKKERDERDRKEREEREARDREERREREEREREERKEKEQKKKKKKKKKSTLR
eukprot:Opistho-2@56727